jgi:hypothetical protein
MTGNAMRGDSGTLVNMINESTPGLASDEPDFAYESNSRRCPWGGMILSNPGSMNEPFRIYMAVIFNG